MAEARSRRRAGGGRAARIKVQQATTGNEAVHGGLSGGRYKPLSQQDMENIHHAALTVLDQTGIADHFPELLDLVLPKGAVMSDHNRLCFPRSLMEDLLANAAREFFVHARGTRQGKDDMHCTAQSVYFANSGTAVTTFDAETKSYRPSNLRDIYDFTRLVDRLDNIHMLGDTVLATDQTDDFTHDMNVVYAMLAGSEKPACLSFRDRAHIPHAIRMFDLAQGGEGAFLKKPSVIFGGCPIVSPLRIGKENMEILIDTAKLGLTVDL
ncbi:MAG: trimethylamine methyltransferase family protein, partial [Pseudomonadota bacterium]